MADRIVIMRAGVIEQVGTPWELYTAPVNQFVAGFIGAPTMNFIDATAVSASKIELKSGQTLALDTPVQPGQGLVVGVRPEHLTLGGDNPIASGSVLLVEPTGPSDFLLVETEVGQLTIVAPSRSAKAGDTVTLSALDTNIHIFDAATGARIDR